MGTKPTEIKQEMEEEEDAAIFINIATRNSLKTKVYSQCSLSVLAGNTDTCTSQKNEGKRTKMNKKKKSWV